MRLTRSEMLMRLALDAQVEARVVNNVTILEEWALFPNGSMWTEEQQMSAFYDDGDYEWEFRTPEQN